MKEKLEKIENLEVERLIRKKLERFKEKEDFKNGVKELYIKQERLKVIQGGVKS